MLFVLLALSAGKKGSTRSVFFYFVSRRRASRWGWPRCLSDVSTDDVVVLGTWENEEYIKTWPSGTICLRTFNRAYFSGSGALETVRIACDLVGTLAGLAKRIHGTK